MEFTLDLNACRGCYLLICCGLKINGFIVSLGSISCVIISTFSLVFIDFVRSMLL